MKHFKEVHEVFLIRIRVHIKTHDQLITFDCVHKNFTGPEEFGALVPTQEQLK